MVWLNTQHMNFPAPKGSFGGSRCTCEECALKREQSPQDNAAKVSNVAAGYVTAQATLETGCELYCRWYDTGQPEMSGKDMAYEMVSFMRKALAEIKGT